MAGLSAPIALLSLALALAPAGARAQDRPAGARPTLLFPPLALADAGDREFRATVLRDLKDSGVFHLVSPAAGGAGTDLMFQFVSHTLARGRVLIEGQCVNMATGAVVLKQRLVGQTAVVDRMAHRMVDFLVGKVTGTPGVADSSIVFARTTAPGIKEIFGVDRDGRNLRQLTAFGSLTIQPAVSRDGRLAFVTYKGGPPQIWGQLTPAGPFRLIYPRASAAGTALSDLAWSPDGRRLCFVQESRLGLAELQVLDLDSGRVARLTEGGASRGPCWSPDGGAIAFISDREGIPQVFVVAGGGGQPRRLTFDPAPKGRVAWNAKGDLAFSAAAGGRSELFTLAPDGTGRREVLSAPEPVVSLCWAPDGRSLLVGLQADGATRLGVAAMDGKLQDLGLEDGQWPQWVRNPVPASRSL
jgi:TolB protein